MGSNRPSMRGVLLFTGGGGGRGYCWVCLEDSGLGRPLLHGKKGTGSAETTPPRSSPAPLPQFSKVAAALTTGRGRGAAGASHHVS